MFKDAGSTPATFSRKRFPNKTAEVLGGFFGVS